MKVGLYIFMGLCVLNTVSSKLELIDNGYEGLVVAVSPDVNENEGLQIIQGIQNSINRTSQALYQATGGRVFFRKVKILIPASWSNSAFNSAEADGENFEESEIRVDLPNPAYEDRPYTLQLGGCGDPGMYIHLTPTYVINEDQDLDFGERGKLLAGEWAKLRWGVFDEVGYEKDDKFPLFYSTDNSEDENKITLCTEKEVNVQVYCSGDIGSLSYDLQYLNANCNYGDIDSGVTTSSLMSFPTIYNSLNLTDFCDDVSSKHPHNTESPTKQNYYCDKRSVWEVIREHQDFANTTSSEPAGYSDPDIQVVQEAYPNYALVMDFSGSMGSFDRSVKLKEIARRWLLEEVADRSSVAMIRFSSQASVIEPLTEIVDENSRERLADALIPLVPDGGTSIGSGLLAAAKILTGTKNPVILLITDGQQNEYPDIPAALQEVINSRAKVITVAFTSLADASLETVAIATGGKTFSVNDVDAEALLEDAFNAVLTYQPMPESAEIGVVIHDPESYTGTETEIGDKFLVDFSVGRNLKFRMTTEDRDNVEDVQLISPNLLTLNATWNDATGSWDANIDLAEIGEWTWTAKVTKPGSSTVNVKVTAQSRDPGTAPIRIISLSDSGNGNASSSYVKVFAMVTQGSNAVIRAHVSASVTPLNDMSLAEFVVLRDGGNPPDMIKDDGIYSAYLTKFNGPERYIVKAQVTGTNSTAINKGSVLNSRRMMRSLVSQRRSSVKPRCCGSVVPVEEENLVYTGAFSRTASGGSMQLIDAPARDEDIFPPSVVSDLKVLMNDEWMPNSNLYNVTLVWTAVGDDLDAGIVSRYDIRVSTNRSELSESNFGVDLLNGSHAIDATTVDLLQAGTQTNFTTLVEMDTSADQPYYFALTATDDTNLTSPVSNIAVLQKPKDNGVSGNHFSIILLLVLVTITLLH